MAALGGIGGLLTARNPEAIGLGAADVAIGIRRMSIGLAWLYQTGFAEN